MNTESTTPITLTIAGSDSGGGAGIQADIKAISATGSYACSVITALTAQNTRGVTGIHAAPADFVAAQLDAVFDDIAVKTVKVGMLADAGIIRLVAEKLVQYRPGALVIDPVMVATSGDLLLESSAIGELKQSLLPLATLITPNLHEAAVLTGRAVPTNRAEMDAMVSDLRALGCQAVLLKGGHLADNPQATDLLITADAVREFHGERIDTRNTHGTGCTLSAAIASYLAQGLSLVQAVAKGKAYLTEALRHADSLAIGRGHGPVHHFFPGHRST